MNSGVAIHPVHPSVRAILAQGHTFRPKDMDRLPTTPEQRELLHRIAMSIFADCTNVGVPFQDALVAVYLSGINHGVNLSRPTDPSAREPRP